MAFHGKHSEETKKKISESRKKYKGKKHPRYGATWTDEQKAKFILSMHQRAVEEKQIKMFLIKHNELYTKFLEKNKQ